MAPKTAPTDDTPIAGFGGDDELDKAIDDLRGVLKSDAEGSIPETTLDTDFGATTETSDFSSSFGADLDADNPFAGSFGTASAETSFDADSFGGGSDLGGSDFGGSSFGGSSFGGSSFDAGAAEDDAFATPSASKPAGSALESNLDLIMDIPIEVQIILGSSKMQVSSLMNLTEGATIGLDRRIGEPVEIMVNGRIIGRGEIAVLENDETRFGVKLIEVIGGKK
ncbi:flagellar motor switch protein FliN [Rhizobium sp. YIM 134829]|uniref:flagellar motor switch protein FliN n=1 Tax=Rhizobium sp. YIM 134829 TaxID=3390453 RepID=UPI00397B5840